MQSECLVQDSSIFSACFHHNLGVCDQAHLKFSYFCCNFPFQISAVVIFLYGLLNAVRYELLCCFCCCHCYIVVWFVAVVVAAADTFVPSRGIDLIIYRTVPVKINKRRRSSEAKRSEEKEERVRLFMLYFSIVAAAAAMLMLLLSKPV